jgi:hypothetical protein
VFKIFHNWQMIITILLALACSALAIFWPQWQDELKVQCYYLDMSDSNSSVKKNFLKPAANKDNLFNRKENVERNQKGEGKKGSGIYMVTYMVEIDINSGNNLNCINETKLGLIPVAILGTEDVDVNNIDLSTVEMDNDSDFMNKCVYPEEKLVKDVNGDAIPDLILFFEAQKIKNAGFLIDRITLFITGKFIDSQITILGSDVLHLCRQGN